MYNCDVYDFYLGEQNQKQKSERAKMESLENTPSIENKPIIHLLLYV